jgi:Na+:H+ antiporter, NhaA family
LATDIAFSVGILVLLAWRIPTNLILFLTALAIADDLGALLIIAIFYSHDLNMMALSAVAGIFLSLIILNQVRRRTPSSSLRLAGYHPLDHHAARPQEQRNCPNNT